MTTKTRRRLTFALGGLFAYVGAYVPLSCSGAYRVDMSGRQRWSSGLALMDAEFWQPKWMYFRTYTDVRGDAVSSGNLLGWLYSPLIMIDRAWVHEDHVVDFDAR